MHIYTDHVKRDLEDSLVSLPSSSCYEGISYKVPFIAFSSSLPTHCLRCEAHGSNPNRSDPIPGSAVSTSLLRSSSEFTIAQSKFPTN